MVQTAINNSIPIAVAGMLADSSFKFADSYTNNAKQTDQVVVTTASNSEVYRVTINGTNFDFTSDASGTKAEIADGLAALINAGTEPVTAVSNGVDTIEISADVPGTAYTISITNPTVGVLTLSNLIPNETSIPFGSFVVRDTTNSNLNEKLARLPSALTDITGSANRLGFALHSHANEQAFFGSTNVGYKTGSTMSVLRRGAVYVVVENAVIAGGQVFVRAIATGTEKRGAVRADADTTDAAAIPGTVFRTGASAGGLAIVEINLPS